LSFLKEAGKLEFMKQFFGAFFGSLVGLIIATVVGVLIVVAVVKSSVKHAMREEHEETESSVNRSVLHLKLHGELVDREVDDPFGKFRLGGHHGEGSGLNMLIKKIKSAKTDDKIKGIYLELKFAGGSYANLTELRNLLLDFKSSGKFIYCYAEYFGQKEYYLGTAASKIYMHPEGMLDFKGLGMSLTFYKHTLEKLGIDVQIFRHGKFKSAIEPFMLDKMSEPNRLQCKAFLNSIWNTVLNGISNERKIPVEELNRMANDLEINSPESAVDHKLIDGLAYEDEVLNMISKKIGLGAGSKLALLPMSRYHAKNLSDMTSRNRVAVIYGIGAISGGQGSDDEIGSDRLAAAIKEARQDEQVKAIVFRVNSPGGSALASDVIWREVKLAKAVKPVIVSMGNYAASGGYYISCAATKIFADPNTITGSIGVFGVLPNFQKALEDKLGVTVDTVNTNQYSSMGNGMMPLREKEKEYIQSSIEKIYNTFTSKVAEGRGMQQAEVDSIGQGRVWTGSDAKRLGLVDEVGGLYDAIQYAVKAAKLDNYRIMELPRPKSKFEELFGDAEDEAEARMLKKNLGSAYVYFRQLQKVISSKGVQARMPYEIVIE
jgi:protease-4